MHKTTGLQEVKTLGPQNREMDAMSGALWPIPGSKEQPGSSKPEVSFQQATCLAGTHGVVTSACPLPLLPGQHVLLCPWGTPLQSSCSSHGPSAGLALATGDGGSAS